jgi:tetratricopeptide (TPR) repeat protein
VTPRPDAPPPPEFEGPLRLAREGLRDEAVSWIESEARQRSGDAAAAAAAAALARVARISEDAEDWTAAERALTVALALRPGFPDLHFHRARVLIATGRRADGRAALERALALHPGYVAARVERALLDAREGLIGEALDSLRQLAREARVEEPRAFERGLACLEEADWREAGAHLARALKVSDPALEEKIERFKALLETGEAAGAATLIRETLASHPGYPDLHYLLGTAELRQGHADDAVATLARALELQPDFHAARVQCARALHALGETRQAIALLAQVLAAVPGHAEAGELEQRWAARGRDAAGRDSGARKGS